MKTSLYKCCQIFMIEKDNPGVGIQVNIISYFKKGINYSISLSTKE